MEMANSGLQDARLRRASEQDLPRIADLMHHAHYAHVHVDWRVPRYWLENGVFLLVERRLPGGNDYHLQGCLAAGADPPPGSWVRVAALRGRHQAAHLLSDMMVACARALADADVTQIGWLPRGSWPAEWMVTLGFAQIDEVVTYVRKGLAIPEDLSRNRTVAIRQVRMSDIPRLVEIERAAFDPLWRHSAESLSLGWQYALSFQVAELDGRVVGFQYSSDSDVPEGGHLVRLTVDPDVQRGGVGSALLVAALQSYRARGLSEASLNTQLSNTPSRRLYEKFGFKPAGYHWPVWSIRPAEFVAPAVNDISRKGEQ